MITDFIRPRVAGTAMANYPEMVRLVYGVPVVVTSDDGGFVTGSTMSINGGQHMY